MQLGEGLRPAEILGEEQIDLPGDFIALMISSHGFITHASFSAVVCKF